MIKAGVTGGIGSGKSTVCRILESKGYPVYYADDRAKWLMENDDDCKKLIITEFGNQSFIDGKINREYLAKTVFADAKKVEKLNKIVHPAVAKDFENWIEQQTSNIIFKEAALLFETGSYQQLDKIILVTAPEEIRIKRVLARDSHRDYEQVKHIISKQLSDNDKAKKADFTVENIKKEDLEAQVLEILENLKNER